MPSLNFGKYKNVDFDKIPLKELDGYLAWLEKIENKSPFVLDAIDKIKDYMSDPAIVDEISRQEWAM